ncbi:MAG TPA: hypothetical protein VLN26_16415, partial [Gaiellaceae bacterium]|nr:hypothetical protein [Gaiellaceae bacterium]
LGRAPLGLGIDGSRRPAAVVYELWKVVAAHPALASEAVALALAAAAIPFVRGRGPWPVAGFGAAMLALTLLPAPEAAAAPLVVGAWLTCTALLLDRRRAAEGGR